MARTDILSRETEIREWISLGLPKVEISRRLKCKVDTLNSYLKKMGIEYAGNQQRKGFIRPAIKEGYKDSSNYLYKGSTISSSKLRIKLIRDGVKKAECEHCGLTEWMGVPIPLELDHINGDHYDNELSNLRILCPNCHALTPTHSGRNKGNYMGN
ncbi:H-N-H homing endonuclease [Serratia phage Slocum]|nr:H-N-H homing endonuclease [Serratia phage Slocum]